MRRKILLFLLVFTLIFGISKVEAKTKKLEVTDIKVENKSDTITVEDPTVSSNEITSGITFNKKDDYVTFKITLKNNEKDKFKIGSIKDNNDNENIDIEYNYDKDYIESGKTGNILIKLTYKNQLLNVDKISLDIKFIIK